MVIGEFLMPYKAAPFKSMLNIGGAGVPGCSASFRQSSSFYYLVIALIFGLVSHCVSAREIDTCKPTFEDNFEGNSLAPHWQIVEGDGCEQSLCGWGNNEVQHYATSQIRVEGGELVIQMAERDGEVVSGKLTTENLFDQKYGRFEARLSFPDARGSWPAFWLLPASSEKWPLKGEIDILEWTGNDPHRVIAAAHFGQLSPENVHYAETLRLPESLLDGFHTVAIEWRPGEIVWEINGRRHAELRPKDIQPHAWIFDESTFYMIINLAVGGTLGGQIVHEDMPAALRVDWVRVFPLSCLD